MSTEREVILEARDVTKVFRTMKGRRLLANDRVSLKVCRGYAERIIADPEPGASFQFLRTGYFCKDPDSTPELPVYNRTVGLRDTFAKQTR